MIELLVAALCVGNYRCDMAGKAYLTYNPAPRVWAKEQYKYVQEMVGEDWLIGASIMYSAVSRHNYQVKVSKNVSIGRVDEGALIIYGGTF